MLRKNRLCMYMEPCSFGLVMIVVSGTHQMSVRSTETVGLMGIQSLGEIISRQLISKEKWFGLAQR